MIYEANEPSSACRPVQADPVETGAPPSGTDPRTMAPARPRGKPRESPSSGAPTGSALGTRRTRIPGRMEMHGLPTPSGAAFCSGDSERNPESGGYHFHCREGGPVDDFVRSRGTPTNSTASKRQVRSNGAESVKRRGFRSNAYSRQIR